MVWLESLEIARGCDTASLTPSVGSPKANHSSTTAVNKHNIRAPTFKSESAEGANALTNQNANTTKALDLTTLGDQLGLSRCVWRREPSEYRSGVCKTPARNDSGQSCTVLAPSEYRTERHLLIQRVGDLNWGGVLNSLLYKFAYSVSREPMFHPKRSAEGAPQ